MTIACLPGRFQPPHLGHVLAIMKIYPLYDRIIVTVSENTFGGRKRQVIPPAMAKRILEDVFQHLPKVKVVLIGKGFFERTSFSDLPEFDVVVTSNVELIRLAEKFGMKTRYIKRTKGLRGWSGTELREALWR